MSRAKKILERSEYISPNELVERWRCARSSVAEAKMLATAWRLDYNHRRPHGGPGCVTPAAFAASLAAPAVGAAPLPSERQAKQEQEVVMRS